MKTRLLSSISLAAVLALTLLAPIQAGAQAAPLVASPVAPASPGAPAPNIKELRGKVVNETGQPLAGVRASWDGSVLTAFQLTGADGRFVLRGVPSKPFQVWVSDGSHFATAPAQMGQDVEVKLFQPSQVAQTVAIRERLTSELASDIGTYWFALPYWNSIGNQRLFNMALQVDKATRPDGTPDSTKVGASFNHYLEVLADKAPQEVGLGVAMLKQVPHEKYGMGALEIALLAARSSDDTARQWASEWYDFQKTLIKQYITHQDPDIETTVAKAFAVSSVGFSLARPDANAYHQLALTMLDQKSSGSVVRYAQHWGRILWFGGQEQFDETISNWSATAQMLAISGALGSVENADDARQLRARLDALAQDPRVQGFEARNKGKTFEPPFTFSIASVQNQACINAVRALARKDARAALDTLKSSPDAGLVQHFAFVVARGALTLEEFEVAREAAQLNLNDNEFGRGHAECMAMLIRDFDPALSQQLIDYVRQQTLTNAYRVGNTIAPYAYFLRTTDPATGRLLLEHEWANWQARHNANGYELQWPLWAMAAYDPARAMEWCEQLPNADNLRHDMKYRIFQVICADSVLRPTLRPGADY